MKVKVFANLREICDASEVEVSVNPPVVINVLEELVRMFPRIEAEIFTEDRELKPFVHLFVNGHNIIHKDGLLTNVKEDDQLALFPPVAGG